MKHYKPTTPSLRHRKLIPPLPTFSPFKPLLLGLNKSGFRNNTGRITIRHRGGGHKRNYRLLDLFRLNSLHSPFIIIRLEKDPFRSSFIALCKTLNPSNFPLPLLHNNNSIWINHFKYFYILAPHNLKPGDIINPHTYTNGTVHKIKDLLIGSKIHNLELLEGKGGQLIRSAGTCGTIIKHSLNNTFIKLPSKKIISLPSNCRATLGSLSNINHNSIILGKAGAARWLGKRPIVRGEAMNPIDHPHGGKTRGGLRKNIWGNLAKWI